MLAFKAFSRIIQLELDNHIVFFLNHRVVKVKPHKGILKDTAV